MFTFCPESLGIELDDILATKHLSALFQPIVSLGKQEIYGYEGLIRGPSDSRLHAPTSLFVTAERYNKTIELDYLCRKTLIEQFASLRLPGRLFLNINPSVLMSPDFKRGLTSQFLDACGLNPNRVVIEITETQPIEEYDLIRSAIEHYRQEGFVIALDDLGAGYSGLKLWSEMHPDFVKIDRHFIADVNNDKVKRQFVNSIIDISRTIGCQVITEGVETEAEYAAVRNLGADFAQGYYFARPTAQPIHSIEPDLFRAEQDRPLMAHKNTAASLLKPMPSIDASCTVNQAADIFLRAPTLQTIAVLSSQQPMGLLLRNNFMNMYAHRFGPDLHGKKPVSLFVEKNILCFDTSTPLEMLSKRLTNAEHAHVDDFVLMEQGVYSGKGTLLDLLKAITHQQIETARYANPLSMLPGNVPIMQELQRRLTRQTPFVATYCDLDHFKPYNDTYGYSKGDEVIFLLSNILRRKIRLDLDFVGHIGGDDFILFLDCDDWQKICEDILSQFKTEIPLHYSVEDRRNGYFIANDRHDEPRSFPIMSLSIGAVFVSAADFPQTTDTISKVVTSAKSLAKRKAGNSLAICALAPIARQLVNRPFSPKKSVSNF